MRFCAHGHFALYLRLQTRLMCVRIARKGEGICSRSGALRQVPAAECIWETSFRPCSRGCPSEAAAEGSCCASRTWTPAGVRGHPQARPRVARAHVGYGADPAEPTLGGLPGDVFPAGRAGTYLSLLLLAHRASCRVRAPCVRRNRALRRNVSEFNTFRARGKNESAVLARPCAG